MDDRTCGWCGIGIGQMQARATYCCIQHKKNAGAKRFRERNPGYYKRYHGSDARVAWLEANRERVRSYAREQQVRYRREHPDAAAKWWSENLDKHRMYQAKRRTATRGGQAFQVTYRDIRRLLLRHDNCCAYCGKRSDSLHVDHVIPLKLGGTHGIGNPVPACQPCNSSKRARLLYPWRITVLLTEYAKTLEA